MSKGITKRSDDYSRWYTDLVLRSELADYSPVKGCMVIRPNGYALWENMQKELDGMLKATGHQNAYFPLFIPESFLHREKEHVKGFAPECAVVTYGGGKELEEKLVVRPTSETIIYSMYSKWIQSYRDLPLLLNQWANVVRWEKRTRLFLRTTEFLWQEGHTVHETEQEAEEEVLRILEIYRTFLEDYLAIPVLTGRKSEAEKFAGALRTYSIEALTQDRRALQAGTSHNLGQNFAKAFNVNFQNRKGEMEFAWQTSWGVSTRLIGGVVMVHGDDQGLILPPRIAPTQVILIPIWKNDEEMREILPMLASIQADLKGVARVASDTREEYSPGWKFNNWELRGVPLRIELGPRDAAKKSVMAVSRLDRKKCVIPQGEIRSRIPVLLEEIQKNLYDRALAFREENSSEVDDYETFRSLMAEQPGFVNAFWCGQASCESKVKEDTKATIRVIPMKETGEKGACILCGNRSEGRVTFAKAY
ncbi:MAG: proline--tRNA ligase [Acidobacteria bacterium]|nr:proline--tRNA ligase [Acidobacteriota bacterium]